MIYINPEGEYPRYYGDIMLAVPGWEKGDELPEGWHLVQETEIPPLGENEVLEQLDPVEVDGVFYQQWATRPMTEEEIDRREAPARARQKLIDLGFTELEIHAISRGL
jgi:hypothetical protein